MRTLLDCIPCVVRQGVQAARLATADVNTQRRVVKALLGELAEADLSGTPMDLGQIVQRVVREVTHCADPYQAVRQRSNAEALLLYPRLRQIVTAASDPLLSAAKAAVAGNIIDFGALAEGFDLEATLDHVLHSPFAVDDSHLLTQHLRTASTVLYLADNAGEIVFDRLLIEQLPVERVVVAVRGEPFINDALLADAQAVGLTEVARVIGAPLPPATTEEFDRVWGSAELVIAKGQANYEAYSEAGGVIFFLLLAKCECIAHDIGVRRGDAVLLKR